ANNAAKGATAQGAAVQAASASSGAGSGAAPVTAGGGESIANLTPNQNAQQAQAAQKPARPAPSQRNVMEQVTVQITKAVNSGLDKINIQLRPASLGRVDVQLEMSGDGRISATIIADSKDTLDMLQRGARDLARALNDAGLQADSQNLNFSLRENNQQQAGNGGSGKDENLDFSEAEDQALNASDIDDPAALEAALRKLVSDGRVDIRA
ncbi:MAG: flagellar hook-length control protein FliK, partial [Rhodospirillaceae bacterium]|nr:flagellar hook-length control protein FliK [Rhodospirillaceae bacterium]